MSTKFESFCERTINDKSLMVMALGLPKLERPNHYSKVYPSLLYTVSALNNDIHKLNAVAHMVYGWMPTIVETFFSKLDSDLFNYIEAGSLDEAFLSRLKSLINNSIVGASKFLHFLEPAKYAIWDSRVFLAITGKKGYGYNVNNVRNFITYMNSLNQYIESNGTVLLKQILIEKNYVNAEATDLRVIESVLFYSTN